jgi:hypothetical protein
MIEGSGPGRGVPWWRWRRVLTLSWVPGMFGAEPHVAGSAQREGRTVAVIGRRR